MPWKVSQDGDKYCVHKMDGEKMGATIPGGCHSKKSDAAAHARAMYASEAKEMTDATLSLLKEISEDAEGNKPERASAVLDEWKARIDQIPNEDNEEKGKNSFDIESRKYAIDRAWEELFPRPETQTQMQPVEVAVQDTRPWIIYYLNDAVILYDNGSYYQAGYTANGEDVEIQSKSEWVEVVRKSEWVAKAWSVNEEFAKKAAERDGEVIPAEANEKPNQPEVTKKDLLGKLKEIGDKIVSLFKSEPVNDTGLSVWKEGNLYWWMARYSNKFRDNDNPPEIISSDSHKRFVQLVKEGKAPLPELWLFHKKEWKVGQAQGVAYDELGFAVALGTFDVGKEYVAEALIKSKEPIRVSHGMPKSTIKYDEVDSSILVEHETREISPLPAWAAANKLTGFAVLNLESKEESMAIPDETKKEWISNLGINPETLNSLEAANAADADKAINEGLESKETEVPAETQPAAVETPADEPKPEDKSVSTVNDELLTAVKETITSILAPLNERLTALETNLTAVKEASEKRDEVLKGTPSASLASILSGFAQSAIGAPENRVDGRTSLAQSKPKEAAAEVTGKTHIPFIDEMLANQ
jgi:hypothetical protein